LCACSPGRHEVAFVASPASIAIRDFAHRDVRDDQLSLRLGIAIASGFVFGDGSPPSGMPEPRRRVASALSRRPRRAPDQWPSIGGSGARHDHARSPAAARAALGRSRPASGGAPRARQRSNPGSACALGRARGSGRTSRRPCDPRHPCPCRRGLRRK
jgi:hypothetical protein